MIKSIAIALIDQAGNRNEVKFDASNINIINNDTPTSATPTKLEIKWDTSVKKYLISVDERFYPMLIEGLVVSV